MVMSDDNCEVGHILAAVLALESCGCPAGRVLARHFRDEVIWNCTDFMLN
jgi:hypothetical protein